MAERSNIEWCDSTWNPWIGCTKISPACDHCYAERDFDLRRHVVQWGAGQARKRTGADNWKKPGRWNTAGAAGRFRECGNCGWRGEIDTAEIDYHCPTCKAFEPLMHARRRVFCASLADWLDNEVPVEWLVDLLELIRSTPNLDWLLLSKRIGNWRKRIEAVIREIDGDDPCELKSWLLAWIDDSTPPNVWLGATICNQDEADRDIPKLLDVPAAVRFLSVEPMLGPVDLKLMQYEDSKERDGDGRIIANTRRRGLRWVICGGESGPHARPMHPHWARDLRDQCAAAGVPFMFKQWGEWAPGENVAKRIGVVQSATWFDGKWLIGTEDLAIEDGHIDDEPDLFRIGKKAAGRLLDGRTHDAFPKGGA